MLTYGKKLFRLRARGNTEINTTRRNAMSLLSAYNGIFDGIKQSHALTEVASKMQLGRIETSVWADYFSAVAEIMLAVRDDATKFEAQLLDLLDEGKESLEYEMLLESIKQVHALYEVSSTINFDHFNEELLRDYLSAIARMVLLLKEKAGSFGEKLLGTAVA
ncbi:MAG: hypothetical protein K0S63_337 [Gammaproteobacteria bacterium]|jgi:hypothetical protein|nr:hypothetical protein [Gammaproteobacteria bacterium]